MSISDIVHSVCEAGTLVLGVLIFAKASRIEHATDGAAHALNALVESKSVTIASQAELIGSQGATIAAHDAGGPNA